VYNELRPLVNSGGYFWQGERTISLLDNSLTEAQRHIVPSVRNHREHRGEDKVENPSLKAYRVVKSMDYEQLANEVGDPLFSSVPSVYFEPP
jgi:hypothetical protein